MGKYTVALAPLGRNSTLRGARHCSRCTGHQSCCLAEAVSAIVTPPDTSASMATQPSACTAVQSNPSRDDKKKRLSLAIVLAPQAAPCIDGKPRQMSLLTAAAFAKVL